MRDDRQSRMILVGMALGRAHVEDAAVAMLKVVMARETTGPGSGSLQILEALRRKLGPLFGCAEIALRCRRCLHCPGAASRKPGCLASGVSPALLWP